MVGGCRVRCRAWTDLRRVFSAELGDRVEGEVELTVESVRLSLGQQEVVVMVVGVDGWAKVEAAGSSPRGSSSPICVSMA
jgi:hypothetical protein